MHRLSEDLDFIVGELANPVPLIGAASLASASSSIWIASGLAKIAALYGASLIRRLSGQPSVMLSPLEYCNTPAVRSLPILVSLRGEHPDAVAAANSIVSREAPGSVMLTCDPSGTAANLLSEGKAPAICSAQLPPRDARFVNCRSIFVLSVLAYRLVRQAIGPSMCPNVDVTRLERSMASVQQRARDVASLIADIPSWRGKQVIFLGDGHASPLATTWQSILAEAGICTSLCVDIKDYTHGDHLAAVQGQNVVFVVLRHGETQAIADIFTSRFRTLFPTIEVFLETGFFERFWENLLLCCEVANALSHHLGYEGGRPPKHPIVHGCRGWGELPSVKSRLTQT